MLHIAQGRNRKDLPLHFDDPVIDYGISEREIVAIFNESKYCYCYDTQTYYTTIAAVCGCIPIVVLEPGKSKKDYVKSDDKTYGVAYGDNEKEIEYAISTRDKLVETLNDDSENKRNAMLFSNYILDYYNNIIL